MAMKHLQGLLAFVETAAAGSLTAAAERLDVTPAAVSKNLARLERDLGVRLFNRSTRRLAITAEGEPFLARARLALRALDEAVAEVSQAAAAPAGRVRISVGAAFGRRFVLPALPALAARHPALCVEVDLDNHPIDLVASGFDIGIRGGFVEDSSLVARHVCGLPLALLASPDYLRRCGVPRRMDDLARHEIVCVRLGSQPVSPWRFLGPGGRALEFAPPTRLVTSDPESVLELALAGAGIAQAALQHALPYLRSRRLKLLLPGLHDPGQRQVVLHYPHRQYLAPRVRVVVEGLLAHFAQAADLHLGVAEAAARWPECVATAPAVSGRGSSAGRARRSRSSSRRDP